MERCQERNLNIDRSGLSWTDSRSKSSLIVRQRFKKHEFQVNCDRRSIRFFEDQDIVLEFVGKLQELQNATMVIGIILGPSRWFL